MHEGISALILSFSLFQSSHICHLYDGKQCLFHLFQHLQNEEVVSNMFICKTASSLSIGFNDRRFVRTMSNSEGVSSVSSPTKKTAAFVLLRPVSRDFLLILF